MGKKSKYKYEGYGVVRDTEIDFPYHTDDIVDLLDEKDQQISDLEAKLKALQNGIIDDETLNMLVKEHKLYKDLEAKLAESEKKAYSRGHSQRDIANEIKLNALREDVANKEKRIVELKQQLAEKEKEIESYKHFKITIGTMENNQVDISSTTYTDQDKISFAIEQLEKVEEILWNSQDIGNVIDNDKFLEKLNYLIKSLKGEK